MKTKDILYIVGGLILGVVIGVLLATVMSGNRITEDQVRAIVDEAVSGQTSPITINQDDIVQAVITTLRTGPQVAQTRDINSTYFLVPIKEAGSWLETVKDVEFNEDAEETLELLYNDITTQSKLALYFTLPDQVTTVNSVLSLVYDAVLKTMRVEDMTTSELVVCLGLDNDPYSLEGPLLYFYMQLPTDVVPNLLDEDNQLPDGWEQLDGPRENSMLWAAECYDPTVVESTSTSTD